jgi:hypothetical protein
MTLTPETEARVKDESATTKAGDWFDARCAGRRLPEHVLPEDTDVLLWTQAMEQQP